MKCPNCGNEMETGYALQLGLAGMIRVVKNQFNPAPGSVSVSVCPICGKAELYIDHQSIK